MIKLDSVPGFSFWDPQVQAAAVYLSQGLSQTETAKLIGTTTRNIRYWMSRGQKKKKGGFSPLEFHLAIHELKGVIGVLSKEFWLGVAQKTLSEMRRAGKFPEGKDLLDFILRLLEVSKGPESGGETTLFLQGKGFSPETILQASKEMRETLLNARIEDARSILDEPPDGEAGESGPQG